jgi:hypothetical protein
MKKSKASIIRREVRKICQKIQESGTEFGIYIVYANGNSCWIDNLKDFEKIDLSPISIDSYSDINIHSSSDINILGFEKGPPESPWNSVYIEDDEPYWEIPFSALLDPEFIAAFDYEFEYRRFNYLFGSQ